MAWTAKSERFRLDGKTAAPDNLGPGSYPITTGIRQADHAYAPFGSTKQRATASKDSLDGTALQVSPPPGAYDPRPPGAYDSGLPKRHVPFHSSAPRAEKTGKDLFPGPGQYEVRGKGPPVMESRTMGAPQGEKPMLRSSSAPSIPRTHQSYGYEEAGGGRLVRQGPKDPTIFLTGRPMECAGPGHYEIPTMLGKSGSCRNGGRFLSGPARTQDKHGDTPGPGHYVKKEFGQSGDPPWRQGSAFASTTDRDRGMTSKDLLENPGPGSYAHVRPSRPDLREMRSELQYFGSTVERFKNDGKDARPGPGSYAQKEFAGHTQPNLRGFCHTAERFKEGKEVKAPGPGSYDAQGTGDAVSGPLGTFSILGNSGGLAFGAMSKRFVGTSKEEVPGPGQYATPIEDDRGPKGKRRTGLATTLPSSSFKSATPKDVLTAQFVKDGLQKPPPGAYNPVPVRDQAAVVRLRSKSEGFLSASSRFGGANKVVKFETPGPGGYTPQKVTGGKKVGSFNRSILDGMPTSGRPKGLGFESQDSRFRTNQSTKVPGPGSYKTDPNWVTKSYNCYFGDLT
mmetsp:Transcript_146887/g.256316  ORF Transcript_146887/g.256316 Transcript_146887/m.256316 type:complete len:565 (-) Transcript_146887:71-1765(-)